MTSDIKDRERNDSLPDYRSRHNFITLCASWEVAAAMGFTASNSSASSAELDVVENDVEIKTHDGTCDADFIHPETGSHPGVLIWTDAFGLRPTFRKFGKRLALESHSVLVPNAFYRSAKAPVFADIASFNCQNDADRAKLKQLMGPLNEVGAADADAKAYIAFLDAQPLQGYQIGLERAPHFTGVAW